MMTPICNRLAVLCCLLVVANVVHAVPSGLEAKKPPKRPAPLQRDGKLPPPIDFKVG